MRVARELRHRGLEVTVHDPMAKLALTEGLEGVVQAGSLEDAVSRVDAVVVCSMLDDYSSVADMVPNDTLVVDCWRSTKSPQGSRVVYLGQPSSDREAAPAPIA